MKSWNPQAIHGQARFPLSDATPSKSMSDENMTHVYVRVFVRALGVRVFLTHDVCA